MSKTKLWMFRLAMVLGINVLFALISAGETLASFGSRCAFTAVLCGSLFLLEDYFKEKKDE